MNAYQGYLIFRRLATYLLECGYTPNDLKEKFGGEQFEGLLQDDTPEEEARKTLRARGSLEMQPTFVRRVNAGAFNVNAVYVFRAVNFENTIYIDPVDLICACRPQLRRVAVLHLIQHEKILPKPMLIRLYKAIDDYNRYKQREGQRPNWGLHMTEAHILAIADAPVPPDALRELAAKAKAKPAVKPSPKPSASTTSSHSAASSGSTTHRPKQPPTPPPGRGGGKDYGGKGAGWNYTGGGYRRV